MAATYDTPSYLLDRANINDTVMKLPLYYDARNAESLEIEVYAPDCSIDYTAIFGGRPDHVTGKQRAADAMDLIKSLDGMQHVVSTVLIQLPQPTGQTSRPDTCKVVANSNHHLVWKKGTEGSMVHNGGRLEFEMVRIKALEEKGMNPWRIHTQTISTLWTSGNPKVYEKMITSVLMRP